MPTKVPTSAAATFSPISDGGAADGAHGDDHAEHGGDDAEAGHGVADAGERVRDGHRLLVLLLEVQVEDLGEVVVLDGAR